MTGKRSRQPFQPWLNHAGMITIRRPRSGLSPAAWAAAMILVAGTVGCENESTSTRKNPGSAEAAPSVAEAAANADETAEAKIKDPPPAEPAKPAPVETPDTQPAATVVNDKPTARVDRPVHDFGTVMIDQSLKHTFQMTNTGGAPLVISKVRPDCGCTKAGDWPKRIEPGQTGMFPFTLLADKIHGRFSKAIKVYTNDRSNPITILTLKGELKRYIEIRPHGAYFGRRYTLEPMEMTLNITSYHTEPIGVELLPIPENCPFDFELSEKTEGREFVLKVKTRPPYEEGTYSRATVQLETTLAKQKIIPVDAVLANA